MALTRGAAHLHDAHAGHRRQNPGGIVFDSAKQLAGLDPQTALIFGNSAYLAADQLIRQCEDESTATDITGLPCLVLPDKTGAKKMVPAARWWLGQSALEQLAALGVTAVYPLPHAGALRVFPLKSIVPA